jgi:hypothetical protein
MRFRGVTTVAPVVFVVALAVGTAACSSDDSDAPSSTAPATTATTVSATTATTAGTTSTTAPPTTQAPPPSTAAPTTAGLTPPPGSPCVLGSNPNCIDPLRTGEGVYLIGGAECIATSPDPALCTDLDGDGIAGYPDYG